MVMLGEGSWMMKKMSEWAVYQEENQYELTVVDDVEALE